MIRGFFSMSRRGVILALFPILVFGAIISPALTRPASAATVSDNFNRADGGLGANWTTVPGTTAPQVVNQTVQPGTAATVNSAYWSADTFSGNQYAQANLANSAGGQFGPGIAVRLSGATGYFLWYGNSANTVSLWRMDNASSWTQLAQSGNLTISASDTWMIRAIGTTISAYQNGTLVTQATDTRYSSGSPGVWLYYASNEITNWSAGDAAMPAAYPVSGTVTGLNGTLVLQDSNAGTTTTITADGPFTLPTQIPAGTTYNVMVRTNPAGQTCTVSNGSGTMGTGGVTNVAVTCAGTSTDGGTGSGPLASSTPVTDNFNRADGPLGVGWADMSDGGLTIASQAVTGADDAGNSGDFRTAETYGGNQYSQIQLTSTQLTGNQWVGPAVRASNGGADLYLGIYFFDNGNPQLMLFKRDSGAFTELGSAETSPLAAGATLQLTASGSTLTFLVNGIPQVSATDTTVTGGAPGIMASGTPRADNWTGGNLADGYPVGGNVTGLNGTLVLQDSNAGTTTITADGPFTLPTHIPVGTTYNITVQNSPASQQCTVTNGSGSVTTGGVSDVSVSCGAIPPSYSVGGTVTGLNGTLVLQDSNAGTTTITADGPFTLPTHIPVGTTYNITVQNSPASQQCTVTNGSGSVTGGVTNVSVACVNNPPGTYTDNFNRADGPLGASWTGTADGGLAISSGTVTGTSGNNITGDVRTGEAYGGDQYSQIQLTATQLSGANQWVGTAVRLTSGGQDGYIGIYAWNGGSPQLKVYERTGTTWVQLGDTASTAPLPAGSTLKLMIVGSSLAFLVNGTEKIAVAATKFTAGAPGVVICGTARADNWRGGAAGFEAHYLSTEASGVQDYDMISARDGGHPETLRVLSPSAPAAGVAHNFLFVLPVEPDGNTTFGDPLQVLQSLNAQNRYNLTIVEPAFSIDPWYADNPNDPTQQQETFMTTELAPWVKSNLATSGSEQSWLIGFSKSGIGGQDLILKHPDVFTLAASWDFPGDISSYSEYGPSAENCYGTNANFLANYQLSAAFLGTHKAAFTASNRIWIGGYEMFQADIADYGARLTAAGIQHTTETPTYMAHRWDSGWIPVALAALYSDSLAFHS